MGEFVHIPLDVADYDVASDPDSEKLFSPVLGARKSLFRNPLEKTVVTEGPEVDKINELLDELGPYIKGDGGTIELIDITNGWARLSMQGECGSCAVSASTLLLIEEEVCTRIPTIKGVESVQDD